MTIVSRIAHAFITLPTEKIMPVIIVITAAAAILIVLIGTVSRFFRWAPVTDIRTAGITAALSFLFPAVFEETLFRAILIPPGADAWPWAIAATVLYVVFHPINGRFLFRAGRIVFMDIRFLAMTAVLGTACAAMYIVSGSLWPSMIVHWLFVCVWLLLLGGYGQMYKKY